MLARWFGYRGNVDGTEGKRWLWETTERILPRVEVGDFNQALMDFGATVCGARDPYCLLCPMKDFCKTYPFDRRA